MSPGESWWGSRAADRLEKLLPPVAPGEGDPRTLLDRIAEWPQGLLLGAAFAVFLILSYAEMREESNTSDEGVHLTAGYSYLVLGDYRLNPEHPPLGKILAALPLLFLDLHWPPNGEDWSQARQWDLSYQILFNSGNDPDRILFWSRVPALFWGLVLLASTYAVARTLYGARGALVTLVVATFSPTLLAHAHLVTTDVIVAALFFLTLTSFSKLFQTGGYRWCVYSGFLLGGALAAKFSAILLLPLVLWMAMVATVRSLRSQAGVATSLRIRRALQWAVHVGVVAGIALLTLWGSYGFRQTVTPDLSYEFDRTQLADVSGGTSGKAFEWAARQGILPDAYVYGYFVVQKHTQEGHPSFALGRFSRMGWWWYFPFAFLVKTPASVLLLMGWGLLAVMDRIRAGSKSEEFLVIGLILYWVMAIFSTINIGVRHILPVFPIMMTLAGGIDLSAPDRVQTARLRRVATTLLAVAMIECLATAPYFLADFNFPSRLFFQRRDLLSDSNLDWGQDLLRLKRYLAREGFQNVKVSYFGCASPRQVGLAHEILPGNNAYTAYEKDWVKAGPFQAGDIVAISASNYSGFLLEDKDLYRRRFGRLQPIAVVGHTIFIYRIPEGFQ